MQEKYIICEDSLEGIFTAVYDAYALREGHEHLHVQVGEEENYRLFAEYLYSRPDLGKNDKVVRTLKSRLGEEVYGTICRAAASYDKTKGDAVYHTIVDGITGQCNNGVSDAGEKSTVKRSARSGGNGRHTMENLRNPYVLKTFELARRTANEVHHELEFIRFQELEQGILYAKIGPENHVVPFLMPHFADRLATENFMIHDEKRAVFGVHPAKGDWYLISGVEGFDEKSLVWSDKELAYQDLFTLFHKTIAIAERRNERLQRQMLPLRFQEYMVEFSQK